MTLQRLGPSDAAVLETFVVPRYLTLFGEAALDMFLSSGAAAVVHLGCRTGYPDELIADRLSSGSIVGLDPSPPVQTTTVSLIGEVRSVLRYTLTDCL